LINIIFFLLIDEIKPSVFTDLTGVSFLVSLFNFTVGFGFEIYIVSLKKKLCGPYFFVPFNVLFSFLLFG
jgi:hypothetical protein